MDTVPRKFVDSVVELFDGEETLDPLAEEVTHPLWKAVVDFHQRNRVYYDIYIRETENSLQLAAQKYGTEIYEDFELIRKNRRFARILQIDYETDEGSESRWKNVKSLEEVDLAKRLESVAPQFQQNSSLFTSDLDCQKTILSSLSSLFFGEIWLHYNGQTSFTFLEKQITHSSFLELINLHEGDDRWPMSVLPLLEQFCLKGRPGRRVFLDIGDPLEAKIDKNFMEKIFDLWKNNGALNFSIECNLKTVDSEDRLTLFNKGQVIQRHEFRRFFRHDTAKSIAVCYSEDYYEEFLEFHTCECDVSTECYLKERYPEFHDF
uniref:FTH domain-containing protein n=1 Tax=Steinernema glaseri TaxID=37863 RepID=A0A1I7ZDM1_9BILA